MCPSISSILPFKCDWVKMSKEYKVTYFPGKGGGEILRLVLSAAGKQFEDVRLNRDAWGQFKSGMYTDTLIQLLFVFSSRCSILINP